MIVELFSGIIKFALKRSLIHGLEISVGENHLLK